MLNNTLNELASPKIYKAAQTSGSSLFRVDAIDADSHVKKQLASVGIVCSTVISIIRCYRDGSLLLFVEGAKIAVSASVASTLLIQEIGIQ